MANYNRPRRNVSAKVAFLTLAGIEVKRVFTVAVLLLITVVCLALTSRAQDTSSAPSTSTPSTAPGQQTSSPPSANPQDTVTVPAGTHFALVLTSGVSSKTVRRGDQIYAQTIAPIAVGNQVVIPPGTFVQGTVDKMTRNGSRAEIQLQSAAVMFPGGFVANATGPIHVESDEGTAWRVAGKGSVAGAIAAPLAGLGVGTLIGHAAGGNGTTVNGLNFNPGGLKDTAIGGMTGLAAGGLVSFFLLSRGREFFVDVGSPMGMTLTQPLVLAEAEVSSAAQDAEEHPVTPVPVAKRPPPDLTPAPTNTGTCYTPDTPGTPPTVIPGMPAVGDVPGTPDTMIPGTPSIPGTPYPCP